MNHWDQVLVEAEELDQLVECPRCDGTGYAQYEPVPGRDQEMGQSVERPCHRCKARGWVPA